MAAISFGVFIVNLETQIDQWLIKIGRSDFCPLVNWQKQQLQNCSYHIISTEAVEQFIIEFLAAVSLGLPVFLADPRWGSIEKQQFTALIATGTPTPGRIMIPTGGTSGQLKLAMHSAATLSAAVGGFQEFYGVTEIDSHCLLPLHHVSGLMQLWRSLITNGRFTFNDFVSSNSFISLVPTQLQRWLPTKFEWLQSFRAVILGGAPAPESLLYQAQMLQVPLSPSYGATETAAMAAAMHPTDFLAGKRGCGQPLPHAQIIIQPGGCLQIQARSIMLGYYPLDRDDPSEGWLTDDLGEFDDQGNLQILGRESQKIISGGEKIFPQQVEAVIWATGLVQDVYVFGLPDVDWGERVVACYVGEVDLAILRMAVADRLSSYKCPKTWFAIAKIPRNSQGKVDRQQLHLQISNLADS
jgi:o-succinylbenzoate---CoA ligase